MGEGLQRAVKAAVRTQYNPAVVTAFFREHGIAEPMYELQFAAPRRWRMDLAWIVPVRLCLEVQGGLFVQGAHVRGTHLLREYEKLNEAAAMGFRVLFVTPDQLCMKETADLVRRCLNL